MNGKVEMLLGIAGSGKTARLVEEYCAQLELSIEQQDPGTTLWITPTHWSRRMLLNRILDYSSSACFAPNIFTFDEFAEKILSAADEPITLIPGAARRTIVRRIIEDLRQENKLAYFSPISETSGFLDLVLDFISELKRDEVWPEKFLATCTSRGAYAKDLELAQIYTDYQLKLHELSVYDEEGRYWSVRNALRGGVPAPFGRFSLVVVDGFTDFTKTQFEILALLAEWGERLLISLSIETPLRRRDLFARTSRIQSCIEAVINFDASAVQLQSDAASADVPAIAHISNHLFSNSRAALRSPNAVGVEFMSATGPLGEVESLAVRIKELLVAGVPADEIIVVYRVFAEQSALINEVFSAAGISHWCDTGASMIGAPVLKSLVLILELERHDWRFEELMAVLGSNYFRPRWAEFEPSTSPRAVAAVLRRYRFFLNRSAILHGLERHLGRHKRALEESARSAETKSSNHPSDPLLEHVESFLRRLSAATEGLRTSHSFKAWFDLLFSLARDLGIAPQTEATDSADELDERDQRAWELFEGMAYKAVQFEHLAFPKARKLNLEKFLDHLNDLLSSQQMRLADCKPGVVRIMDMSQVRSLDIPFLFLAGLSETDVPRIQRDDCIYHETERQELNRHGLALREHATQSQDEMLLFYGVVTRARKSLVMSYPSISDTGQPLFPSPYVAAVRQLFEADAIRMTHGRGLDPVPEATRVVSPAGLRLVATAETAESRPGLFRALCEREESCETAQNILASVDACVQRFHTSGFTRFDGLLRDPKNTSRLVKLFDSAYQFSATQLESYAACPFRFFLSNILNVDRPDTSEFNTDFRSRGIIAHKLLAKLHQQLIDQNATPAQFMTDAITERLRGLVDEEYGRARIESDFQSALREVERQ